MDLTQTILSTVGSLFLLIILIVLGLKVGKLVFKIVSGVVSLALVALLCYCVYNFTTIL